jgi:hypothetical protein
MFFRRGNIAVPTRSDTRYAGFKIYFPEQLNINPI